MYFNTPSEFLVAVYISGNTSGFSNEELKCFSHEHHTSHTAVVRYVVSAGM